MQRHDHRQGTPEWLAHRMQCWNASDAPAMLGCSPYETRSAFIARMATGISPEVDPATQRRFDDGHRFEGLARPLAEDVVGEELFPVIGSLDIGLSKPLGASFDGLTILDDTVFEHKTLGERLRYDWDEGNGDHLPKDYRVQCEQQLLVSGAERALFMATRWEGDTCVERKHCWYASDPTLRAEILAGWKQAEKDIAAFVPPAASTVEKIVAEPVEALPAPIVQVSGQLTLTDNFKVFETRLRDFLEHRLIREPKSDEDFVNLDAQIKAMKQAREALKAAEAQMLAQVDPVDQAKKTKDMLDKLLQQHVSMAEGLLKSEKERRKTEIVTRGTAAIQAHIDALNARLGGRYMPTILADFASVIRGLKSLASMEDKVATELARLKIGANEIADRIDANLKHLREHAGDYRALFPDETVIVQKAPEDLQALVASRIAAHKAEQERRAAELAERERGRIRAEEEARARAQAQREQQEREAAERRQREEQEALERRAAAQSLASASGCAGGGGAGEGEEAVRIRVDFPSAAPAANVHPMPTRAPAPPTQPTLMLREINARLQHFTVTADGLRALGFEPAARQGSALMYHEADWPAICDAIVDHVTDARDARKAA